MATVAGSMMRINWVLAADFEAPSDLSSDSLKTVGPTWGSHKTWRSLGTDNVGCHDLERARQLIDRAFQAVCNFYLPKKFYVDLGRPIGVKLYEGDFEPEVKDIEDIVCLHLAAKTSDLVLLMGFDFSLSETVTDRLKLHQMRHRHGLMRSVIVNNPEVQWVLLNDDGSKIDKSYQDITNLTCDTLQNALKLLV